MSNYLFPGGPWRTPLASPAGGVCLLPVVTLSIVTLIPVVEVAGELAVAVGLSSSSSSSIMVVSHELIFSYVDEGAVCEVDLELVPVLREICFAL